MSDRWCRSCDQNVARYPHQVWCARKGQKEIVAALKKPKKAAEVTAYSCLLGHRFLSNLELGDALCPTCRSKELKIESEEVRDILGGSERIEKIEHEDL